jgi:hypothetical protein
MPVAANPIDVWDVHTFDPALIALLEDGANLIRDYLETDRQIFRSFELNDGPDRPLLRPENPYTSEFLVFEEAIGREMQERTIRAFHYTRLTDSEVSALKRNGIHLSTPASLQGRLDDIVAAGDLPRDVADQLYNQSPFHSDQLRARSDKYWMTSHPVAIDDRGVRPLLKYWGGEVASMWIRDKAFSAPLASLGKPRIIEVAVPMSATPHSHRAGTAVITTFARSRGATPPKGDFDICTKQPLPPTAVLAVHTEGDWRFIVMGRGYPVGFVDVSTGEDE